MLEQEPNLTREAIQNWLGDPDVWPTGDSYELDSLTPCLTLGCREKDFKGKMPEWFWKGEKGGSSIGTGKGYFERKFWGEIR